MSPHELTIEHELVDSIGTALRRFHASAFFEKNIDILQLHAGVWCGPVGRNLPQEHAERPDVRLDGEAVIDKALRCCPFDRKLGTFPRPVRNITLHVARQPKIRDLHGHRLAH